MTICAIFLSFSSSFIMQERIKHDKYLNQTIKDSSLGKIKSQRYRQIISKYGNWLDALVKEKIKPITKEQENFIYEFKKLCNKKYRQYFENEYIAALCLWKGYSWVKSVSYTLRFKNVRATSSEKFKNNTTSSKKFKNNKYYASLKPNLNPKKKKLDPTKTYRWTDQGFQTREGHKVMNSKKYKNSLNNRIKE